MHSTHIASGGRYPVLRTLGILYLVGAAFMLVVGAIGAFWALVKAPDDMGTRAVYALLALSGTFFVVVMMLAAAEVIKLMIDIERNTRAAAQSAAFSATNSVATTAAAMAADGNGKPVGGRMTWLEGEETAEGALLRGH